MKKNRSPWLHQLDADRPLYTLHSDISTDIAIVGAGIAGIATAFYALKYTGKDVVMVERFKLAHGATGHNGGQIVSYFERGFASLVAEFGLRSAAAAQSAIEDAWDLLDEMYQDAGLTMPLSRFVGHAGLLSLDHVENHLANNLLRREGGLPLEEIRIAEDATFLRDLSRDYDGLYRAVPRSEIQAILETELPDFVASISYKKGCLNSALFCQEVLAYLLKRYEGRFTLYEHTPIRKVVLRHTDALLDAGTHTVTAARVILCTNGFENVTIFNEAGLDINTKYHHLINGRIGYMSGYLEKDNKPPTAISYMIDPHATADAPYIYLTRRPYEYESGQAHNLISVGGPEVELPEMAPYSHEDIYPDEMSADIDAFLRKTYDIDPNKTIEYVFTWHGLMGYTRNGVRLIGPEPKNPVLLYNLGCNGVGILPSLYGGRVLARHIAGEEVPPSIFDVPTVLPDAASAAEVTGLTAKEI